MKKYFLFAPFLMVAINVFLPSRSMAQITINGMTCVTAGGSNGNVYTISGNTNGADKITWTVTGGVIVGNNTGTASGSIDAIGNQIRVVWNNSLTTGKINISCDRLGKSSLSVNIISINNTISTGKLNYPLGASFTITGAGPLSKGCVPMFNYWWEKSDAATGPFNAIDNESGQHLQVAQLSGKTFYRRVLSINGDIIYSNVLAVGVAQ
jgi:hypothetical protein